MPSTARPALKFDHAGVVVRDLAQGFQSIKALLPVTLTTERFDDPQLGVSVQFVQDEDCSVSRWELFHGSRERNPIHGRS